MTSQNRLYNRKKLRLTGLHRSGPVIFTFRNKTDRSRSRLRSRKANNRTGPDLQTLPMTTCPVTRFAHRPHHDPPCHPFCAQNPSHPALSPVSCTEPTTICHVTRFVHRTCHIPPHHPFCLASCTSAHAMLSPFMSSHTAHLLLTPICFPYNTVSG